jgi:gentisate 1,2-dioxygenase
MTTRTTRETDYLARRLDIPLVQSLQQLLFEPHPEYAQPIEKTSEEVAFSVVMLGQPAPAAEFFHYKWSDTYRRLNALVEAAAPDRFDGYLWNIGTQRQRVHHADDPMCSESSPPRTGDRSASSHQHRYCHAFRGSGSSFVGDERFDWEAGDSFVVPLWYPHRHSIARHLRKPFCFP